MKVPSRINIVFERLESNGFEAYIVGGAVRDYVQGRGSAKDWDVATNASPGQLEMVFGEYHLIKTGLKHGTVTVVIDDEPIEITTYRQEGDYSDHRHPDTVSFTRNLKDDLERRDFTMNALAYNPRVGIVDLVGGKNDIENGVLRCVGDPGRRFREDGLRMLRALRFASVLGMKIEAATADAVHQNKCLLPYIAPERIQSELTKMLCGSEIQEVLMNFRDVLAVLLPEIVPMFNFDQHNPHHDKDVWSHTVSVVSAIPADPILRWAALLHDIGKPGCFSIGEDSVGHFYGHAECSTKIAEEILNRLRFDNWSKERILRLIRFHDLPISAERKPIKRMLNKHGTDVVRQLIELHKADTLGQAPICAGRIAEYEQVRGIVEEILEEDDCFTLKKLAINGNDMGMLGLQGREIGEALKYCLNMVIEEKAANERAILVEIADHWKKGRIRE